MKEQLNILLNSTTETEVLEFKKAERQFDKDKLGRYFSALSNEANLNNIPCAWLLFGIDNNKIITGTTISDKQLNDFKLEIANNTSPTFNFLSVKRIETDNGNVIMLQIPPAPQGMPIAWKNHYFARNGESLDGLSIEKIERIRGQVKRFDWSKEIIEDASLKNLDDTAIAKARKQYISKNSHLADVVPTWDDITFLNKARITIDGKITRTAIILLGEAESEHFINPATSKISWILRDKDNIEKDYKHYTCPLIIEVENVHSKIRNLKYRYIKDESLFPDEVDQYDPYIIREAINNCIAHQDYTIGGRINIIERDDGILIFSNSGDFIPQSIERVIVSDTPETEYRNPFLANAMVNLNMIDTIGSGIRRMFILQKNKYFPLPEYDFSNKKVTLRIIGKVIDLNFAKKLAQMPNLSLYEIMLLDKVSKNKLITPNEIKLLKAKKLIEGRKPNFYISSKLAGVANEKEDYIKQRGFKDVHYKQLIIELITKYGSTSKSEIDKLLLDILPSILDKQQKENKVRNIIYSMSKRDKTIENKGTTRYPKWVLSSSKNK